MINEAKEEVRENQSTRTQPTITGLGDGERGHESSNIDGI